MSEEQRLHDIELAVIELARITEHLVCAAGKKRMGITVRQGLLHAVDNVRALCTPETSDDDPDDDPPAAGALPVGVRGLSPAWLPEDLYAVSSGSGVIALHVRAGGAKILEFPPGSFDSSRFFMDDPSDEAA